MTQLITTDLVELDQNLGNSPEDVIRHLAGEVVATGRATEVEGLFADAFAREQKTATGIPGGIAIPHCRSTAVTEPTLVMARLSQAVDFGAKDGPADLIFFIAAPEGADQEHLKLLSKLARSLIKKDFTASLRAAGPRPRSSNSSKAPSRTSPPPQPPQPPLLPAQPPPAQPLPVRPPSPQRPGPPPQAPRGRHRLPDRHRPHLHGGRLARGRGQGSRGRPAGGDPGFRRRQAAGPRRHRRRRRRDLRRGRRRARQGAFRGQARHQRPGQARHRRAGRDGPGGPRRRRQPQCPPRPARGAEDRPSRRPRKGEHIGTRS